MRASQALVLGGKARALMQGRYHVSVADVRADAAAALAVSPAVQTHRHFVGCDRACGSPAEGQVLIATGDGYRPRDDHP